MHDPNDQLLNTTLLTILIKSGIHVKIASLKLAGGEDPPGALNPTLSGQAQRELPGFLHALRGRRPQHRRQAGARQEFGAPGSSIPRRCFRLEKDPRGRLTPEGPELQRGRRRRGARAVGAA